MVHIHHVFSLLKLLPFLLVFPLVSLLGCGGGGGSTGNGGGDAGFGMLTVEVDWPARNLMFVPTYAESLKCTINVSGNQQTIIINRFGDDAYTGVSQFPDPIPAGNRTLVVDAYTQQDAKGSKVATASVSVQIIENETTTKNISADLKTTIHVLRITGQPIKVETGSNAQLTGHAENSSGQVILLPPGTLKWSLVNGASYGSVTEDGVFTGIAPGTSTVRLSEPEAAKTVQANVEVVAPQVFYQFYFISDKDDEFGEGINAIYTVKSNGTGLQKLTQVEAIYAHPKISPNGTKLIFISDIDGYDEIYTMNVNGTGLTQITSDEYPKMHPTFSPDGSKIAFAKNVNGNWDIYTMNANGSGEVRLTFDEGADTYPRYSPDGSTIVFESDREGDLNIYTMSSNGANVVKLTNHHAHDWAPSFSPDGTKIVFLSERHGPTDVYIMNANGSGVTRLTFTAEIEGEPVFTPDGVKIAFAVEKNNGFFDIAIMGAGGGAFTNLTNSPWNEVFPTIYFAP